MMPPFDRVVQLRAPAAVSHGGIVLAVVSVAHRDDLAWGEVAQRAWGCCCFSCRCFHHHREHR
ncbi:hypothetical protein ACFPRL_36055 [Pseudoclavibacter helvolus]